jgi:hypothetical protein
MINRRALLSSLALLPRALQRQTAIAQQTRRGGNFDFFRLPCTVTRGR